eukprot:9435682-Alexandrium_andersonii.AAC.1
MGDSGSSPTVSSTKASAISAHGAAHAHDATPTGSSPTVSSTKANAISARSTTHCACWGHNSELS